MHTFLIALTVAITIFSGTELQCHGFVTRCTSNVIRTSRNLVDNVGRTTSFHMAAGEDNHQPSNTTTPVTIDNNQASQLSGPVHHTAVKTRNITLAIQFYSLLGFEPTVKFRTGPARAAWLEQIQTNSPPSPSNARIELIEIPSFMLNEPEGTKARAVDLMQRQELLGHNHMALDVTASMEHHPNCTTVTDWMQRVNEKSLELFNKTLRVALEPRQQMIGNAVYELAFIYDADGALLELLRKQEDLPQAVGDGWEPWDGEGFVQQ